MASGLLIPLIEYCQPLVDRVVRMTETADFPTIADMIAVLNEPLKIAPDFAEVPPTNHANQIYKDKSGDKLPYKSALRLIQKNLSMSQTRRSPS